EVIKNIIFQIGNGLRYLHSYGIIHRDLKPENVLIDVKNYNLKVKIVDFGLSVVSGFDFITSSTLGTVNYITPEVINGEDYNCKVDIWALGIIMYYLFFEILPFKDKSSSKLIIAKNILEYKFKIPNYRKISKDVEFLLYNT